MTNNETVLFNIVKENENPEFAVLTSIKVFSAFLEQLEEVPMLQADGLQVSV